MMVGMRKIELVCLRVRRRDGKDHTFWEIIIKFGVLSGSGYSIQALLRRLG